MQSDEELFEKWWRSVRMHESRTAKQGWMAKAGSMEVVAWRFKLDSCSPWEYLHTDPMDDRWEPVYGEKKH